MNPPLNVVLYPLILCAGGARPDWHQKNLREIVLSNRRVRRQVHARRHLADRLFRRAGRVAFSRAETFSNCLRRRLKPEPLRKPQPEQAGRAIPELESQMPEAGLEQPRRWAQPRRLELPWRLEELVVGCVPMRRRTVLKLAQPISERRLAEQEWTWTTEISSSPFSPICHPLAPVLSSLALRFAAGRPVRPEPRLVWLVRLEPARFVQGEAQRR